MRPSCYDTATVLMREEVPMLQFLGPEMSCSFEKLCYLHPVKIADKHYNKRISKPSISA
jgi:hypothetical protein